MKLYKNTQEIVAITFEILSFHANRNEVLFHVDVMFSNEKTNSLKFNERKIILRID